MNSAPPTPPAPPGWNKTVRDLFDEMGRGLRSSVVLLVYWRSPSTTDVEYTLPAGCRLRVESAAADRPITVLAMPLDVKAVEKAALSLWTRIRPDYRGFGVALDTSEIVRSFLLVSHPEATR